MDLPAPTGCRLRPAWTRAWRRTSHFVDLLLPRHCVLCCAPCGPENLCAGCRADLPRPAAACPHCALPCRLPVTAPCARCRARPPPWDGAIAALDYDFPVDALVARFKFNRQFACGRALAVRLAEALAEAFPAAGADRPVPLPDAIVPVPLHRLREFRRSFNQADLLARAAGRALDLPVRPELLRRKRHTRAQAGLGARERRRNLRNAFEVPARAAGEMAGARLALVDDVLTTGATLGACSRALRRAGALRVDVWVAARAAPPGRSQPP